MQIVTDLKQGTQEWLAHRKWPMRNASDAPTVMGVGDKSRDNLLTEKATGIINPVDSFTQNLYDEGHRFEELARPLAEKLIGSELYPITGYEGLYSASFDGITMNESIIFEHKSMNNEICACITVDDLSDKYKIQMEHQLYVSGAERCLFMATKWDDRNKLLEESHFWYKSYPRLLKKLLAAWDQFAKDVKDYKHFIVEELPKSDIVQSLPSVIVQVKGELTCCNINDIRPLFDEFLSNALTNLETDEDFAQAEAESKVGRETAKRCLATAKSVVDQTLSISEVTRELESYAVKFNALALAQEKAVKEQKELRKATAKAEREKAFNEHIFALNEELKPVSIMVNPPDWDAAMKNQRLLSSLYGKLNDALADGKIRADEVAKDLRKKLSWYNSYVTATQFLFNDLNNIINDNGLEAFQSIVKGRVSEYAVTKEFELEAERKRIKEEEQLKAKAEQERQMELERAEIARQERAKIEEETLKQRLADQSEVRKQQQLLREQQIILAEQRTENQKIRTQQIRDAEEEKVRLSIEEKSKTRTIDIEEHERLISAYATLQSFFVAGIEETDWYKKHNFTRNL